VRRLALAAAALAASLARAPRASAAGEDATVVVVVGAAGTPEYGERFATAAGLWQKAAARAGARHLAVGLDPAAGAPDRKRLEEILAREAGRGGGPLWVVLLGHGTFDGRTARFNLRGPDVTADELGVWLKPLRRPLVLIDSAPASAPFLKALAGPDRVIVTATKTGNEQNATRLGDILARTVADPGADLDKDGQTSVLESFLAASTLVEASFQEAGLLATEHALLEDNGDGLGTPASFFRGVRAVKKAESGAQPDGRRAHQIHLLASAPERALPADLRKRRDELELRVFELRDARERLGAEAYYARLEPLLVELARIYQRAERR
jgi:hypothetical protein